VALLDSIREPADLRRLPRTALAQAAAALRDELIARGAARGGHFAGSLGTVELTVALHYVFDTPADRLIWDVGHQAYGHKVLTGRREALARIRQEDGPSGFLRRSESCFDVFGAGHAGTSVSAALGIAEALRRKGDASHVVAVIGDGAATAGMAFEALNHAGHLAGEAPALRVVYNENGMSIAPNVGGLSRSGDVRGYAESLGVPYAGPVDGHDVEALIDALVALRASSGPALLHVRTKKGCGFAPAEDDPFKWHATTPFDVATGTRKPVSPAPPTWTACFAGALASVARRDPRVVAITAAMLEGTGLATVANRFPGRVYDVGIAEQHAVTFAAGLACEGVRPVVAIYSTFLQRAFDQIVHDVALQRLPVTFALDRGGLVGADGKTHQGAFDLSYLRCIPNLTVMAPADENEMRHMLHTALQLEGPAAFRFPRASGAGVSLDPSPEALPLGKGRLLRKGGNRPDVAVIACGTVARAAVAAAEALAREGVEVAVVDARFVKPLDEELVCSVAAAARRVVTVEEGALAGGFGAACLEAFDRRGVLAAGLRLRRLGLPDQFVTHGDAGKQRAAFWLDASGIAATCRELLGERRATEVA